MVRPTELPAWSCSLGFWHCKLVDIRCKPHQALLCHCSRHAAPRHVTHSALPSAKEAWQLSLRLAGMLWQWDLSRTLGWAHNANRRGCWHSLHGLIEARREEWSWPLPLGVVPWSDTPRYVAALPHSSVGAFVVAGVNPVPAPAAPDSRPRLLHPAALRSWQRQWDRQAERADGAGFADSVGENAMMVLSLSGILR